MGAYRLLGPVIKKKNLTVVFTEGEQRQGILLDRHLIGLQKHAQLLASLCASSRRLRQRSTPRRRREQSTGNSKKTSNRASRAAWAQPLKFMLNCKGYSFVTCMSCSTDSTLKRSEGYLPIYSLLRVAAAAPVTCVTMAFSRGMSR
jgi:hypothetical protein